MIRRILATILIVLGLTAIGLGVASATIWRSSDTVSAALPVDPTEPVLVVQPGVLGMVADTVTLTATAASPEAPILLAFAPAGDVTAWVGAAAHVAVTGMSSWTELDVEAISGEPTVPNPAGADLWTTELAGTGEFVAELSPDPGQVALLAATDGTQPAPTITLTWQVPVSNPYLVPLLGGGAVLVLAGVAILTYDLLVRREVRARAESRQARRTADATETSLLPAAVEARPVGVEATAAAPTILAPPAMGLTRRQLRELERLRRQADPRLAADGPVAESGGTAGAGIVPAAPDPERHRALRHVDLADLPDVAAIRSSATTVEDGGPARGSAIVPGVAVPESFRETGSERTSWRELWGFGEEEQK